MKPPVSELNVISFEVPYPADYGGVIEVYARLQALHQIGVKVHLHCFVSHKEPHPHLQEICHAVNYYPRKKGWLSHFSLLPYIVKSRAASGMLSNLLSNQAPILFEGLHSTFLIHLPTLQDRRMFIRMHNVESSYYRYLSLQSRDLFKKWYYRLEAWKLKRYENGLNAAHTLLMINKAEMETLRNNKARLRYLPAFHPFLPVEPMPKAMDFALYHGNLQVEENQRAVSFLLECFSELQVELIIAGRLPSVELKKKINDLSNIKLLENPSERKLNELIHTARLICLPTFQPTGIKIKLLKSLIEGNQVIANSDMLHGSGLETFCEVAETKAEWLTKIPYLMKSNLNKEEIRQRQQEVYKMYDPLKNAKLLMEWFAQAQ
jgi:hypothetical protein